MTELTSHLVEGQTTDLKITAIDESCYRYDITGFNVGANPCADQVDQDSYQLASIGSEDPETAEQLLEELIKGSTLSVLFQNGLSAKAVSNGITIEALLAIIKHRLEYFQAGPLACIENDAALKNVDAALEALKSRTKARILLGVKGTMEARPGAEIGLPVEAEPELEPLIKVPKPS